MQTGGQTGDNERRTLKRFDLDVAVEVEIVPAVEKKSPRRSPGGLPDSSLYFRSRDISADGCFLKTDAPLPFGTMLHLRVALHGERPGERHQAGIGCAGRVIRSEAGGMAIRFEKWQGIAPTATV